MAPRRDYTPEQMGKAIEAVRKGAKIAVAAKSFGIPRITLYNKIKGNTPVNCTMGPDTILSKEQELILVRWVLALSEIHFPITKENLQDSVQKIITDQKLPNPFTNNRPGKKWCKSFLKRHPILVEKVPENLSKARHNVSEKDIRFWFKEIDEYLDHNNLKEIIEDPSRVFNADESAFFLSPKPGRVLARKGESHLYSVCGDDKENLTVLFTGNAAGVLAPPMIVFSYERIPANIVASVPETWGIGKSDSGWMCSSTFYEYVTNILNPWLIENDITKPILFFIDGHKSHLTLHLSNFCAENKIEIIALYPNSTHILQPMDLAVFRPLKVFWKKAVNEWKVENLGQNLKRDTFAPVLQKAVQKLTVDCIKNGFKAGGLYPFGPDNIDMTKLKHKEKEIEQPVEANPESLAFIKHLESEIVTEFSEDKLKLFKELFNKSSDIVEQRLPDQDMALYTIWAKKTKECGSKVPSSDPLAVDIPSTSTAITTAVGNNDLSQCSPQDDANEPRSDSILDQMLLPTQPPECTSRKDENMDIPRNYLTPRKIDHTKEPPGPLGLPLEDQNQDVQDEVFDNLALSVPLVPNTGSVDIAVAGPSNPRATAHNNLSMESVMGVIVPSPFKKHLFWPEVDNTKKKGSRIKREKIPSAITSKAWREYHEKKEIIRKKQQDEKVERAKVRLEKRMLKEKIAEEKTLKQKLAKEERNKINLKRKKKSSDEASTSEESDLDIQFAESGDSCADESYDNISEEEMDNSSQISMTKNMQVVRRQEKQPKRQRTQSRKALSGSEKEVPLNKFKKSAAVMGAKQNISLGCYVIVKYEGEFFPGKVEDVNDNQYEVSTMSLSVGNSFRWPEKPDKIWYRVDQVIEKIDEPLCCNKRGFYKIKEMEKYLPDLLYT